MGKYRLVLIVLMITMILSSIYVHADEISIDYKNGYNDGMQKENLMELLLEIMMLKTRLIQ
ncbi:hypothetical protein ACF3M2_16415 [Tissierella carlieri]|uniref:hypothetical protein n=1 Tax=Tissierella carlieri TaxID=689904 RepID=UPI00386A3B8A